MTVYKKNGAELKLGEVVRVKDVPYYVEDIDQGYVYVVSMDEEKRRKKLTATSLGFKYDPKDREKFLKASHALRDYWQD